MNPSLSSQTIACLQFFNRWETPLDNQAHKAYGRLRQAAPDFESFQKLARPAAKIDGRSSGTWPPLTMPAV